MIFYEYNWLSSIVSFEQKLFYNFAFCIQQLPLFNSKVQIKQLQTSVCKF